MRALLHLWAGRMAGLVLLASLWPAVVTLNGRLQPPAPSPALPVSAAAASDADAASALGTILAAAPFGQPPQEAPVARPDAIAGLVLLGVTVAADPAASRAIIAGGADGAVAGYRPGQMVADGLMLSAVAADGVTLGGGAWLGFPEAGGRVAAERTTAPAALIDFSGAAPAVGDDDGLRARLGDGLPALLAELGLAREATGIRVAGDPGLLAAAGLRTGDLVTTVQGRPVADWLAPDAAGREALYDAVIGGAAVEIGLDRGGQALTLRYRQP
jgi:hypothetical protein